ncbi:hypothetical protein V5T82_04445 [Magnetovibrio sp. PR-2]|uniref:hypothetical protein n=1 Tax=Magnetovibrio sp. PR-2 TaxID=3120356 RepID=UPI002FCE2D0B
MDRNSFLFCVGSLVVSLLIAIVAFPYVSMDVQSLEAANTPRPAHEMGSVDVGNGFGKLTVEELMAFYVESPPVEEGASAPEIRFGGC